MLSDDILSSRDTSGLLVYFRKCLLVVTVARSDTKMHACQGGSKTTGDNLTLYIQCYNSPQPQRFYLVSYPWRILIIFQAFFSWQFPVYGYQDPVSKSSANWTTTTKNVLTSAFILKMTYILVVAEFLDDKLKVCIYEELRLQTVREWWANGKARNRTSYSGLCLCFQIHSPPELEI